MNGLRWAFKGTPRWIVGSEKLIRRIVDSVDRQTNDSMVGLLGRVCVPAPVTDSIVGALRRGNLCPPGKSDLLRAGWLHSTSRQSGDSGGREGHGGQAVWPSVSSLI